MQIFRAPARDPVLVGRAALAAFYAEHRFRLPALHADILRRIVIGNRVADHERVTGLGPTPVEALAVYEIENGLIRSVWFF